MALFDRIKRALAPQDSGPVIAGVRAECPSLEHMKAASAIESVTAAFMASAHRSDHWCVFEGRDLGRRVEVQFAQAGLNTLLEDVDLPCMLERAGRVDLATRTQKVVTGLFVIDRATPAEVAVAVDAVFMHHFGFRSGYEVVARIE